MFAVQHVYVSIVNLLMAAGADVKARGTHGFSALDFARQNRHLEVVTLLQ